MSKLKIAISGIGAVGGYYGGRLAAFYQSSPDIDIYFISRGENLRIIKERGLTIQMSSETIHTTPTLVTDKPETVGEVNYLLCCTKSYDLEENIIQLTPLIGSNTVILPLLNGANISERIQHILPLHTVWQGCVYIGARLKEAGLIEKFSEKERFFFGTPDHDPRQKELLSILINAGINAFNPEDITLRIWKKFFMISTAATITSYYNQTIDEVITQHKDMFIALGKELKMVAKAKSILLSDTIEEDSVEAQKMMPPGSTTSMHSDFIRGSQTELENLTGYVVQTARSLHIETPIYETMYNSLKASLNK